MLQRRQPVAPTAAGSTAGCTAGWTAPTVGLLPVGQPVAAAAPPCVHMSYSHASGYMMPPLQGPGTESSGGTPMEVRLRACHASL